MICFCHSFVVLNIDTWVSLPGSFINAVAAAFMPRLTKVEIANLAKLLKPYPLWITAHLFEKIFNFCHGYMIPLLIPLSRDLKDVHPPTLGVRNRWKLLGIGPGEEKS